MHPYLYVIRPIKKKEKSYAQNTNQLFFDENEIILQHIVIVSFSDYWIALEKTEDKYGHCVKCQDRFCSASFTFRFIILPTLTLGSVILVSHSFNMIN